MHQLLLAEAAVLQATERRHAAARPRPLKLSAEARETLEKRRCTVEAASPEAVPLVTCGLAPNLSYPLRGSRSMYPFKLYPLPKSRSMYPQLYPA